MSGGVDRLVTQAADKLSFELHLDYDCATAGGMSPIEALLALAIRTYADLDKIAFRQESSKPSDPADMTAFVLYVERQVRVLDWPVDFLVSAVDSRPGEANKVRTAVIECDGHEFHERTKEQATRDRSRDRRLQDDGHRVFRFTGSEIYRNPLDCAREVYVWAYGVWTASVWGGLGFERPPT